MLFQEKNKTISEVYKGVLSLLRGWFNLNDNQNVLLKCGC